MNNIVFFFPPIKGNILASFVEYTNIPHQSDKKSLSSIFPSDNAVSGRRIVHHGVNVGNKTMSGLL
jgi:hypothetical protein